jgi:hypothetical protein
VRLDRLVTALALGGSAGAAFLCIGSTAFAARVPAAADVPSDEPATDQRQE